MKLFKFNHRQFLEIASILLFLLSIQIKSSAQKSLKPIAASIEQAIHKHSSFQSVNLFSKIEFNQSIISSGSPSIENLVKLEVNESVLSGLMRSKPEFIQCTLPVPGSEFIQVLLERQEVFGADSRIITQDDPIGHPLTGGVYYRGILQDDSESFAAISFVNDEIIGVFSNQELGNLVLGKTQSNGSGTRSLDKSHYIYQESALPQRNPFQCGMDDLHLPLISKNLDIAAAESTFPSKCKAVKIFLECSNRLYTDRGSSQAAVTAYMTGLFNVVKALYANENVVIEISDIMVWTTADPYLKTTLAEIIYDYANRRKNNFNGTLAQLVTTYPIQQQGGIAFVDGMCKIWDGQYAPLSFAFINNTYSSLPTYSWSVEVMAHEMGHNFGSWHTHTCVWGPNKNSQIDNCQPPDNGGTCNNGVAPVGGGTIMSYCHLTSYGINFSKGFGQEPGDILRNSFANKSCIPSSFTPIATHNIKGPYFEGDSFRLNAKPYNKNYKYEWLHYDYVFNQNNDTAITAKNSGIYRLAISSSNCTEYSTPDTVIFNDFVVNLGCPVIAGERDSVFSEISLQVDNANYSIDSLDFPKGLYGQIPTNALDPLVEIQMTITPKGASFTRSVTSKYESPANIGIYNDNFTPNDQVAFSQKTPTTFRRILGNFDPAGIWKFQSIDIRTDAGIDAIVNFKIVLSWRMRDSVSICDLPLCSNKNKQLDAGIPNAKYQWTSGEVSKSISTSKEGSIGVSVQKNGRTSSHQVNLVQIPTSFKQTQSICEGNSLMVGQHRYTAAGEYVDSFQTISGCDSILHTTLEVRPIARSSESKFVCYATTDHGITLYKDTSITLSFTGFNLCDSLHTINYQVNKNIDAVFDYEKKCNDQGTDLQVRASGGSGTYTYTWFNQDSNQILRNLKSGNYTLTITDDKNCQKTFQFDLVNYDSISVREEVTDVLCFGDKNGSIKLEVLTGTPPFGYNWNNGKQTKKIEELSVGKYNVLIFDANGCKFTKDFDIHAPDLLVVSADVQASNGTNGSVQLNIFGGKSPFSILWNTGDTSVHLRGLTPGTYTVTVTDQNGCTNVQSYEVQNKLSTVNYSKLDLVQMFPNPCSGIVYLQSSNQTIRELNVMDALGKCMMQKKGMNVRDSFLDLGDYPAGYYVIRVVLQNGRFQEKMLLKM